MSNVNAWGAFAQGLIGGYQYADKIQREKEAADEQTRRYNEELQMKKQEVEYQHQRDLIADKKANATLALQYAKENNNNTYKQMELLTKGLSSGSIDAGLNFANAYGKKSNTNLTYGKVNVSGKDVIFSVPSNSGVDFGVVNSEINNGSKKYRVDEMNQLQVNAGDDNWTTVSQGMFASSFLAADKEGSFEQQGYAQHVLDSQNKGVAPMSKMEFHKQWKSGDGSLSEKTKLFESFTPNEQEKLSKAGYNPGDEIALSVAESHLKRPEKPTDIETASENSKLRLQGKSVILGKSQYNQEVAAKNEEVLRNTLTPKEKDTLDQFNSGVRLEQSLDRVYNQFNKNIKDGVYSGNVINDYIRNKAAEYGGMEWLDKLIGTTVDGTEAEKEKAFRRLEAEGSAGRMVASILRSMSGLAASEKEAARTFAYSILGDATKSIEARMRVLSNYMKEVKKDNVIMAKSIGDRMQYTAGEYLYGSKTSSNDGWSTMTINGKQVKVRKK